MVPRGGRISIEVVIERFGGRRVRGREERVRSSKALKYSSRAVAFSS